jgi:hypothetical protein
MAMLLVGLLANAVGAGATIQSPRALAGLTLPEDRLPPGCRLNPVVPRPPIGASGVVVISGNSEPNPLISQERRVAAEIRRSVDGAPPQPDGPPLMPSAAARWGSRWAEDVVEAYRATYRLADESLITVAAIQFNDPRLATPEPPMGTRSAARGMTSRIVLGPTVALIAADAGSECFRAIEDYLRSVR